MLYRVTAFSAFAKPKHFENLDTQLALDTVKEGKEQQFKMVVTSMDEPEPTNMYQESTYIDPK